MANLQPNLQPIQEIPQDLVQRIMLLELTDEQKSTIQKGLNNAVELNHRGNYMDSVLALSDLTVDVMLQATQGYLCIPVAEEVNRILDKIMYYPSLNGLLHSYNLAESGLRGLAKRAAENGGIMEEYLDSMQSCIDQVVDFAQRGKINAQGAIQDLHDLIQLVTGIPTQQEHLSQPCRRYYN